MARSVARWEWYAAFLLGGMSGYADGRGHPWTAVLVCVVAATVRTGLDLRRARASGLPSSAADRKDRP